MCKVSLFGAHLDFKSAVFRLYLENSPPFPPLEFKSAVFRVRMETYWKVQMYTNFHTTSVDYWTLGGKIEKYRDG